MTNPIPDTKRHWGMVAAYSAMHFLIDFACAFLMFRSIAGTPDGYLCVLLYNFCAFAMQMPLGLIADKLNRNIWVAVLGCGLVSLAYVFLQAPVLAVIMVGMGNAMFHIGGGIDVLNISEKKLGALGIFVSPGAFGVYYGTMLGKGSTLPAFLIPLVLIVAAGLMLLSYKAQRGTTPQNAAFSLERVDSLRSLTAAACLFFVVALRSFVGLTLNFSWKGIGLWGTILICAVVFGKTIGGFAADRFGIIKTSVFSLGFAAILFLFPAVPVAGVAAVLLFNMTMPITLWIMAKIFPGAKGFSFGLLTFALFIGFLPVYFNVKIPLGAAWLFAPLAAISLAVLLVGNRKAKI